MNLIVNKYYTIDKEGEVMTYIQFDFQNPIIFKETQMIKFQQQLKNIHHKLCVQKQQKNPCLDWMNIHQTEDNFKIQELAKKIRNRFQFLVVIGIGGSYAGAKAAIEMLQGTMNHGTKILFVGQNMSSSYIHQILEQLHDKDFAIHMISKSGSTLEPALAFRIFRTFLEKKYGENGAQERIFVTTNPNDGNLLKLSQKKKYTIFALPENICGRFSVLTSVGLLPMAVAGIDIEYVQKGATTAYKELFSQIFNFNNPVYQYVLYRNLLYQSGKKIELFVNYDPDMLAFGKWWSQLFAESEGKNHKGIFPSTVIFSTDLHTIGQYIQEGERHLFETVLWFENTLSNITIEADFENLDGLNDLAGQTLQNINKKAFLGTLQAHVEGGVPNFILTIPKKDAFSFGYLVYFFELAVTLSSYLNKVDPFNQPGVEAYKDYMYSLLDQCPIE